MLQQRSKETSVIYDVCYQTQSKREYLFKIRTTQSNEYLQNKFRQNIVEMIKNFQYSAYNKIITLNLQKLPQNIKETIKDEQKLLQFIQSRMNDKRVANKTILIKQIPIPKQIIYIGNSIFNVLSGNQKPKNKTHRDSTQTSNLINNRYEASQSETLLPDGNIQSSVFYGCGIELILKILQKGNSSQKNKGDIGELVSLPFTCQRCPDGIYRRNYISQYQRVKAIVCEEKVTKKSVDIVIGYIQPKKLTQKLRDQFEIFKEHEFYRMLAISNDFINDTKFGISSNVPTVDNSIVLQTIGNKHLLMIVRQDKIGYNEEDIIDMVNKGIISLVETIDKIKRFNEYEIDLIYTLAWSRNLNKNNSKRKTILSPLYNNQLQITLQVEVMDYVIQHFDGQKYQSLMNRLHISIFAENNLSDKVIKQSAGLYKVFSRQYPEYKENFIKVSDTLISLTQSTEFHRLCNTTEYEFFLPSTYYIDNIQKIEKIIQKIKMKPLRDRILDGLQTYKNLYNTNIIISEHSSLSLIEEEPEEEDEYTIYFVE